MAETEINGGSIGRPNIQQNDIINQHDPMRPRKIIGSYVMTKTLGRGSMGKVKLATNIETNKKVAVKLVTRKIISKHKLSLKEQKSEAAREIRTIREASIMLLLDHPYIAKVYEMTLIDNFYYIFMEYVDGGQLLDYIIAHGKLKEKQARQFSRQIASALDYCHRNSIVHRDLKVENILISREGNIKIIDFGLSNVFSPRSHLSTFCGSLYFAAPELLEGRLYTGPEVDVWSFGIVLYVLVCGQVPFDDPTMGGMHAKVKQGYVVYPSHLSSDCKHLLQHMIVTNRKKRATMSEVIVHPWLNKGYDSPVENYLPKRKPLQLPIDMKVVHGMRGFEFGPEESIKEELEFLISSDEYQQAAKYLEASVCLPATNGPTHHRSNLLKRRSFMLPPNDPQSMPEAYHPLISVYYLVQERMQRENKKNGITVTATGNDDTVSSANHVHELPLNEPSIGVSYTVDGKSEVHSAPAPRTMLQFSTDSPPVTSVSSKGHCRNKSDTSGTTLVPPTNVFRRWSRRWSRSSGHSDQPPSISTQHSHPHQARVRPLSQCLPNDRTPVVTLNDSPVHVTSSSNTNLGQKFNRFLKRAKSITTAKDLPSTELKSKSSEDHCHHPLQPFNPDAVPIDEIRTRHHHSEDNATDHHNAYLAIPSPISPPSKDNPEIRADLVVKPVLIKGLFSVSTTSTKKASEIRRELIRVLNKKQIGYREKVDRFECFLLQGNATGSQGFAVEYSDDDDDIINSRGTTVAVRFEIYIVKIPWLLGMRGIRFRRISGDTWQYKNMCSKILDSLRL